MRSTLRRILSSTLAAGFIAMIAAAPARAQEAPYRFDLGADLGMCGYLGEASSSIFSHPGFTADAAMRYIPNARMAFRGIVSVQGISGTTAGMANVLPDMAAYDFTATVAALDLRYEFNFLPYGIGETYKRLSRWTPYLTLGVGVSMSSSGGSTAAAPILPMGAGVKVKLRKRLNFNAEFTMTKAFGDRLDGDRLHDLNQIKTEFYRSTDWYARLTIGVSYEFGERCATCHYVD
ncbi:MAG: outer membrane beta-barrel protein [Bacteroides sp.]|nr:outer membrane beta-barrel protein [Bacteroides sp.]MBD5277587.1 outer membrane beta-barrel protein [Bacteroides sp.]MDE6043231.1 outer membrane beta-barrel protein [Muribaculaceae bacterium]